METSDMNSPVATMNHEQDVSCAPEEDLEQPGPISEDTSEDPAPLKNLKNDFSNAALGLHDFVTELLVEVPDAIPEQLLLPLTGVDRPQMAEMTFLERSLYAMLNAVASNWSAERRAMDALLSAIWALMAYAIGLGVRRVTGRVAGDAESWKEADFNAGARYPDRALQSLMKSAMPGMTTHLPARTMATAQNRLGRPPTILVHPCCPYYECQRVYYHLDGPDQLSAIGEACPFCQKPFEEGADKSVLLFPRQTLVSELERVLSIPGIEASCFQNRRSDLSADQAEYGTRVRRHQCDGDLWNIIGPDGTKFGDSDVIRINLIVDWYQTIRTSFGGTNSNGPLLGHIANLPSQARGNMAFTLVLGITPGEYRNLLET